MSTSLKSVTTAAVSLIAIPIGFASLSTLWFTRQYSTAGSIFSSNQEKLSSPLEKYLAFEKDLTSTNQENEIKYLWKSFEGVVIILKFAKDLLSEFYTPEQLIKFYNIINYVQQKQLARYSPFTSSSQLSLSKIIVLEGLPQSGVSTLIYHLTQRSTVKYCPQFDEIILTILSNLLSLPISFQNAFTLFCDYYKFSLAEELSIRESCYVILDRYYHSTFVQHVQKSFLNNLHEIKIENISPYAYHWPIDLPYPILIVYLVVPFEEKYQRKQHKLIQKNNNEKKQFQFENTLQTLYSLIEGPPIIAMDASGDELTVLETFFQCLESQSLYIRSYSSSPSPSPSRLPAEDSLTLMDCLEDKIERGRGRGNGRGRRRGRSSMKGITLNELERGGEEEEQEGGVQRIRPFSQKYSNKEEEEVSEVRESLGVYGAIMQVNWDDDH